MRGMFSTLAIIWRLASPYFRSEDKWAGRVLLAAVIAIELSIVGINVLLNSWNNSFYNALQDKRLERICLSAWLFLCPGYGVHTSCCVPALSKPMASDSLAAVVDANLPRSLARGRQPLPHATAWRRRGQPRPAYRRRHQAIHRADAEHRASAAQFLCHAALLLGHPVGVVGGRASALVWSKTGHSRLSAMGRADLRLHRYRPHASHWPRADCTQFPAAAV